MNWCILVLAAVITACRSQLPEHSSVSVIVNPSDLNAEHEKYDGLQVAVRGFLFHESENHAIWNESSDPNLSEARYCVSVLYPKELASDLKRVNRKVVVLTGLFHKDIDDISGPGDVFLGLCNNSVIEVNGVVLTNAGVEPN